jgi:putative PEP-CTERM system histidine kinase
MNLGVMSHAAAALAFVAIALLLAVSWKGGGVGMRFIVACSTSALWAAIAVAQAWGGRQLPAAVMFSSELLRDAAWLIALTGLAGGLLPRLLAGIAQWSCLALLPVVWASQLFAPALLPGRMANAIMVPTGIIVAVIVLLLLEQIYRNSSSTGRYGFKFLAVGLGGVYAYDLFMYSQALLFKGIAEDFWDTRGVVNAALAPLIAVAARRNPHWSLDVFVSRQAVLFTTSIVAVGIYLLLMALGGYYLQIVGGTWGTIANLLFESGAIIVLAIVIMSGAVRRRLRVFMHKHFYRNKYDYRVEWLRFVETLSAARGQSMQRTSLQAIAQVFESEEAVLYVRSPSAPRYEVAAAWPWSTEEGREPATVPESHEFITALREKRWVIDLREYHEAPEFYQNLELPEAIRSSNSHRIIAPLLEGEALRGFVLLREPPPPFELTYEDRDLLLTMGRHVAVILAQQESERRLGEGRQFEAYHRLTAFMMHDLKNLVAQLNLVVRNSERHRANPQFVDDAFATVANAASRMGQLIAQLSRRDLEGQAAPVDVRGVTEEAVRNCTDRDRAALLLSSADPAVPVIVLADRARMVSVIEHVIRNAQDASGMASQVQVIVRTVGNLVEIEVRDQGEGMTAEFVRSRLFKPFDSTKGSKGMGIGAYQVLEYARSIGGDVEVQSSPGSGTSFAIRLPRHE